MGLAMRSVATATAALALASAPPASAAPVHECGNGVFGIWNVTSRVVGCQTARKVARRATQKAYHKHFRYKRWKCRIVHSYYDYSDLRCTRSGGRVVRWQAGG